jgi:hypothetical protein
MRSFAAMAHYFFDSGGEVREENTLGSRKVPLFPQIAAMRRILRFVVYFGPKHEEDLWADLHRQRPFAE